MFFFDDVFTTDGQQLTGLRGTMLGTLGICLLIIAALCVTSFVLIKLVFRKQLANFTASHPILGGYLKKLPFIILALSFVALEIAKQIQIVQEILAERYEGITYDLYSIPVHISSMPLYFFPIAAFAKPGSKLEKYGFTLSAIGATVITTIVLIAPYSVFGSAVAIINGALGDVPGFNFLFIWHPILNHMVTVMGCALIFTMGYQTSIKKVNINGAEKTKLDKLRLGICFAVTLCYVLIMLLLAFSLNENWGNALDFPGLASLKPIAGGFVYKLLVFVMQSFPFILMTYLTLIFPYNIKQLNRFIKAKKTKLVAVNSASNLVDNEDEVEVK
jgi:hypothetical protein